MERIEKVFDHLTKEGKRVFIPYITAGDPNMDKTYDLLKFLAEGKADIIEVGVPFSDPMADGPTIQKAMERALKSGTNLEQILEVLKNFRKTYKTPLILMGYMNPFFSYGLERFAEDAEKAEIDAVLAVDLPPEEAKEFQGFLNKKNITLIFLASPLTDEKRIKVIKKHAQGFVYFVSVTGVTGERKELPLEIIEKIKLIKSTIRLPLALGFGISSSRIIKEFYPYVDGFVVGSALIRRWEDSSFKVDADQFKEFFFELEKTCHRG